MATAIQLSRTTPIGIRGLPGRLQEAGAAGDLAVEVAGSNSRPHTAS